MNKTAIATIGLCLGAWFATQTYGQDLLGTYVQGSHANKTRFFVAKASGEFNWKTGNDLARAAAKKVIADNVTMASEKRLDVPNDYIIIGATDGKDLDWYYVHGLTSDCYYYRDNSKDERFHSSGRWISHNKKTLSNTDYTYGIQFADDDHDNIAIGFHGPRYDPQ